MRSPFSAFGTAEKRLMGFGLFEKFKPQDVTEEKMKADGPEAEKAKQTPEKHEKELTPDAMQKWLETKVGTARKNADDQTAALRKRVQDTQKTVTDLQNQNADGAKMADDAAFVVDSSVRGPFAQEVTTPVNRVDAAPIVTAQAGAGGAANLETQEKQVKDVAARTEGGNAALEGRSGTEGKA